MKTYSIPFVFLSLLSDSNQRPRDYKSGAGRIGLTHFCFASAKVDIFFETAILSCTFF